MNKKLSPEESVIVAARRTALGAFQGGLKSVPAQRLAGLVAKELIRQTGVPEADVDELMLGNVLGSGLGQNPARQAAAIAGLPFESSALTIDMVCGSGLRAVCLASQAVKLKESSVVIAGGAENMSLAPQLIIGEGPGEKVSSLKYDGLRCAFSGEPMGMAAEWLARKYGVSRKEQDDYAFKSQMRAAESVSNGLFQPEIVPVSVPDKKTGESICSKDECPRGDSSLEKLASLKPAFKENGTVTAGNSTPVADGAAGVIVTAESYARATGLQPIARIVSCCTAGVDPQATFTAPIAAVRKLLAKTGLAIADIDVFEANDSFAVQAIVCRRELGWDPERVNVRGGTLALGHPLGASGCRILVTLLHILKAEKKRLGVAVICLGGGNAVAMLVENYGI